MFRIRRIHDDARPIDQNAIVQVKAIMKSNFSTLSEEKLDEVSMQLKDLQDLMTIKFLITHLTY